MCPLRALRWFKLQFRAAWCQGRSGCRAGTAPPSLFGFQSRDKHTDDKGDDSKALSKDASSHQQLGLPVFALMEGAETVHESSRCPQTTWKSTGTEVTLRSEVRQAVSKSNYTNLSTNSNNCAEIINFSWSLTSSYLNATSKCRVNPSRLGNNLALSDATCIANLSGRKGSPWFSG